MSLPSGAPVRFAVRAAVLAALGAGAWIVLRPPAVPARDDDRYAAAREGHAALLAEAAAANGPRRLPREGAAEGTAFGFYAAFDRRAASLDEISRAEGMMEGNPDEGRVRAFLEDYATAVRGVRRGAAAPVRGTCEEAARGPAARGPHGGTVRIAAVAVLLGARRAAAEGRPREAVEELADLFTYGSDLAAGPGFGSLASGTAVMGETLGTLEGILERTEFPPEERAAIRRLLLAVFADVPGDRRALLGEMLAFGSTLRLAAYGELAEGGAPEGTFLAGAAESWAFYDRWRREAAAALEQPPGPERIEALRVLDEGPIRKEENFLQVRPPRLLSAVAFLGNLRARAAGLLLALSRVEEPAATLEGIAAAEGLEGPVVRDLPPGSVRPGEGSSVEVRTFDREGNPLVLRLRTHP